MRWSIIAVLWAGCATAEPGEYPHDGAVEVPWTVDACDPAPIGEGFDQGQVLPDVALTNQLGGSTRLYDFCGRVILLQVAGFW